MIFFAEISFLHLFEGQKVANRVYYGEIAISFIKTRFLNESVEVL